MWGWRILKSIRSDSAWGGQSHEVWIGIKKSLNQKGRKKIPMEKMLGGGDITPPLRREDVWSANPCQKPRGGLSRET